MIAFVQTMKTGTIAAATAAMLLTALPTPADAQSTGSVRFRVASAGFIIGTGGGTGTLNFKGRTYPLSVGGLSVGTIGVSSADLVGTASNLRSARDIVGSYSVGRRRLRRGRWRAGDHAAELQRRRAAAARTAGRLLSHAWRRRRQHHDAVGRPFARSSGPTFRLAETMTCHTRGRYATRLVVEPHVCAFV